jgi:hypothetical protein
MDFKTVKDMDSKIIKTFEVGNAVVTLSRNNTGYHRIQVKHNNANSGTCTHPMHGNVMIHPEGNDSIRLEYLELDCDDQIMQICMPISAM